MPANDPEPSASATQTPSASVAGSPGAVDRAGKPLKTYPTRWQLKMLWMAITGLSLLTLGALAVFIVLGTGRVIGHLQAFLLPVAVAGVLTYLLAPLVDKLRARGMGHKNAALIVFLGFIISAGVLMVAVAVPVAGQFRQLAQKAPSYYHQIETLLQDNFSPEGFSGLVKKWEDHPLVGPIIRFSPLSSKKDGENGAANGETSRDGEMTGDEAPNGDVRPPLAAPPEAPANRDENGQPPLVAEPATADGEPAPGPDGRAENSITPEIPGVASEGDIEAESIPPPMDLSEIREWLAVQAPRWARKTWEALLRSIGGGFAVFGFILNFLLVPIYLFFFLRETHSIQANWSNYLPLRASRFKDEIVSLVQEINGYLIAFFRGQMLVSLIDGFFTAVILQIIGLKFGLLIGVLVGILGIVPYIGIMLCFIPAIILAIVQSTQGGWDFWGLWQSPPWWVLPVLVTGTFLLVNNLDGIFIAPKIVGDSVGLHPLVIIASVIFWSLLLGGVLGAVLAVPLTATIQVLFRRYIWQRQVADSGPPPPEGPPSAGSTAIVPSAPAEIVPAKQVKPAPPAAAAAKPTPKRARPARRKKA